MSIDSPTPSRHPEVSGSSYYSRISNDNHRLKDPSAQGDSDTNVSSNYHPAYSSYKSQSTLKGKKNVSNAAVYDDTRSSPYKRTSVPVRHPLPRIPTQSTYQVSDYYSPEEDEQLHEIPIHMEDSQYSYSEHEEDNREDLGAEMKRYINFMVNELGKKFENSIKQNASSTKGTNGAQDPYVKAYESLVNLTPIQDRNSYFGQTVPDVIPSPNWSEASLDKTVNPNSEAEAAKELLKLKQFLKDIPNGGQLLDSFEKGKSAPIVTEKSIFETPQPQNVKSGASTEEATVRTFGAARKVSSMKEARPDPHIYQSTPVEASRQSLANLQPHRVSSRSKSKENEGPRNTVSFAAEPPRAASKVSVASNSPGNSNSYSKPQSVGSLPMSSATITGSGSPSFEPTDAGILKLLTYLAEKDAKIEELQNSLSSTQKELEAAKKYIYKLRGTGKAIGREAMPDARKKVPESQKLYKRLEMSSVDALGNVNLQNLVKNILLVLGVPFSQLPGKLKIITEVLKQEYVYTKFANEIHRVLYSKEIDGRGDLYSPEVSVCLANMVALVRQLDSERS